MKAKEINETIALKKGWKHYPDTVAPWVLYDEDENIINSLVECPDYCGDWNITRTLLEDFTEKDKNKIICSGRPARFLPREVSEYWLGLHL